MDLSKHKRPLNVKINQNHRLKTSILGRSPIHDEIFGLPINESLRQFKNDTFFNCTKELKDGPPDQVRRCRNLCLVNKFKNTEFKVVLKWPKVRRCITN